MADKRPITSMTAVDDDEREPSGRWHSLRFRILVWALPALAILLLAVVVVDTFAYQWVVTFVAEQRDEEIAQASAARLAFQTEELARGLLAVAQMLPISTGDTSSRAVALGQLVSRSPELYADEVSLLDEYGRVITSQPRRSASQNYPLSELDDFLAAVRSVEPQFSDVLIDEPTGRAMIVLTVPVRSPAGQPRGALRRSFFLGGSALSSQMPHLGTDHPGIIYVLDRQGRVIHHPSASSLSRQLPPDSPLMKEAARMESGAYLITRPDGEVQVVGHAVVPGIGWRIVLQEPWEVTAAPFRSYLWLGSLALLSGAILSIAAMLWGAGRISTPVDHLVSQAEEVVRSDYRTRVQSEPINELQRLAAAFNNMIGQIARYRAGLRRYVAAITQSQEEERRRIARELHDDTIQSLVAISRRLELVQASLHDARLAQQQVNAVQELVQSTIESVRRFSRELRPTLLEDLGLIPALRRLVRDLALEGAVANVAVSGSLGDVSPSVELALYRIAQEAIHNVAQHSQAHHVNVHLDMQSELIHLSVEDDGLGFDMSGGLSELAQQGNFGLMGIRERVELLGGQMDLLSEPGSGTRLQVWLPRSVDASDAA